MRTRAKPCRRPQPSGTAVSERLAALKPRFWQFRTVQYLPRAAPESLCWPRSQWNGRSVRTGGPPCSAPHATTRAPAEQVECPGCHEQFAGDDLQELAHIDYLQDRVIEWEDDRLLPRRLAARLLEITREDRTAIRARLTQVQREGGRIPVVSETGKLRVRGQPGLAASQPRAATAPAIPAVQTFVRGATYPAARGVAYPAGAQPVAGTRRSGLGTRAQVALPAIPVAAQTSFRGADASKAEHNTTPGGTRYSARTRPPAGQARSVEPAAPVATGLLLEAGRHLSALRTDPERLARAWACC